MTLLSVADAQARLLDGAVPLAAEAVALQEALGRRLAQDVVARRDQPWADLSAMDGYAIRHAELPGPWRLAGESRAGGTPPGEPLALGTTMRIFTGAPLPAGADCVLVQEEAAVADGMVRLDGDGPDQPGRNVRPRGNDFTEGAVVISAGTRIGPAQMALAAMAAVDRMEVHRRARVAILSSGDELVPIGSPLGPGQIPSSNAAMLSALLTEAGAEVIDLGIAPDRLDTIVAAFAALPPCDLLLTSGGASVGDHDLIAPALREAGGRLDFWKIAMRPGKPLMAGALGDVRFLGLPGNPVSAFVTATLFVLPLVRRLMGAIAPMPPRLPLPCHVPLPGCGPRAEYLRARADATGIVELMGRDSAALDPLARANVLIERPPHSQPVAANGQVVSAILLGSEGFA